jgi:hypothetical protein
MIQKLFRVAMSNSLGMASYMTPATVQGRGREWLIVARSGDGKYIEISDSGEIVGEGLSAPDEITPNNTMFGILLREAESEAVFLLVRHLPFSASVTGRFFPVDGYVSIVRSEGNLGLHASGRHAHSEGNINGTDVLYDIPFPAPGAGRAWHFDAKYVPWGGESNV